MPRRRGCPVAEAYKLACRHSTLIRSIISRLRRRLPVPPVARSLRHTRVANGPPIACAKCGNVEHVRVLTVSTWAPCWALFATSSASRAASLAMKTGARPVIGCRATVGCKSAAVGRGMLSQQWWANEGVNKERGATPPELHLGSICMPTRRNETPTCDRVVHPHARKRHTRIGTTRYMRARRGGAPTCDENGEMAASARDGEHACVQQDRAFAHNKIARPASTLAYDMRLLALTVDLARPHATGRWSNTTIAKDGEVARG
ncbi:hypothetical protein BD779DRAFT_1472814 [Infundibulicybe gibba]|nr:hypothetical protein BD779DRAFT_1472814 [Infundibulicybe gibba]